MALFEGLTTRGMKAPLAQLLAAAAAGFQPLSAILTAISNLATTGLIARTGSGTVATRTITGTANEIAVANGDGVSGNPTLSLPSTVDFSGKTTVFTTGSFSPTITFATPGDLSVTYSIQSGVYQRVGNTVRVNIRILTSAFTYTTATGGFLVSGLPFTAAAGVGQPLACAMAQYTFAGFVVTIGEVLAGTSTLQFVAGGSGVGLGSLNETHVLSGSTMNIYLGGQYNV